VHLGGATGLHANFGRKLRAHKVTSAASTTTSPDVVDATSPSARRRVVRGLGRPADEERVRGGRP
jgi:sulfite reductase (ferredoxin)